MKTDCGEVLRHLEHPVFVTGLNLGCRQARDVVRRMYRNSDCYLRQCDIGPYRCRDTELGAFTQFGRCVNRRDPFHALDYAYGVPA